MTLTVDERMVHILTGRGQGARFRDARLADVLGDREMSDLSDAQFLRRCEDWLELNRGELRNRVIDVTDEGNVIVAAPKVYG